MKEGGSVRFDDLFFFAIEVEYKRAGFLLGRALGFDAAYQVVHAVILIFCYGRMRVDRILKDFKNSLDLLSTRIVAIAF